MKTAPFRCIVVFAVWLVIYIWIGLQIRGVLDIGSAVFGAAIFGFISYKIWQKFDPDYQGWTEGKDTLDVPPDNEYDSKVQTALKRKREQERVDDKKP